MTRLLQIYSEEFENETDIGTTFRKKIIGFLANNFFVWSDFMIFLLLCIISNAIYLKNQKTLNHSG